MDWIDWVLVAALAAMVGGGSFLLGVSAGIQIGINRTVAALAEELKELNENHNENLVD